MKNGKLVVATLAALLGLGIFAVLHGCTKQEEQQAGQIVKQAVDDGITVLENNTVAVQSTLASLTKAGLVKLAKTHPGDAALAAKTLGDQATAAAQYFSGSNTFLASDVQASLATLGKSVPASAGSIVTGAVSALQLAVSIPAENTVVTPVEAKLIVAACTGIAQACTVYQASLTPAAAPPATTIK